MSLKKIAEMTGLSTATVSHALNGTRSVSEKSRLLVQEAADKIGYKPSLAAQMLRTQRSGIVALIIPASSPTNDTNSFYFGVLNGARAALEEEGYDMIVTTYPERAEHVPLEKLRVLANRMVEGVLLVPYSREKGSADSLLDLDVPTVLLDRRVVDCPLPVVASDNHSAAVQVVELLAASGRRNIAFMGGKTSNSTVRERQKGYREALARLGIPHSRSLELTGLPDRVEEGCNGTALLLERGADAIFAENSMLMVGVEKYCRENGVKIPEQLSLAGFDNAPWMEITDPPITAVQQSADEMGMQGAKLLVGLIRGESGLPNEIVIPTQLVKRESH
ncbi:MAG: LacI family DNA-binding transcriptional regulator [Oscillospiraceae bacterium]